MGVNTVKQVLTSQLATSETLVLAERLDAYRHADSASHVLLVKNTAARYRTPDDFTVAVDGRGKATVTWLSADALPVGAELNFGFWQYDGTTNGTNTGGGGGGVSGDINLDEVNGVVTATNAGDVNDGTQRVVVATNQPAIPVSGPLTNAQLTAQALATQATLQELVDLQGAAGGVIVVPEGCSWQYVAANSTDSAVGNANDLLDSILVVPSSTAPGAVSLEDGAGTNYTLFAGGSGSILTLHSFEISLKNIAAGTTWEITAGANLALWVFYRPRT